MLPSETMIWQPEFTDKTLSRKPGAVHANNTLTAMQNMCCPAQLFIENVQSFVSVS
ncbi:putative transposase [Escherichia coli 3-475-03_S3_C2]|nr:putative transposase [Escherichia coli 3-475-03_S3_C2]